MTVHDFVEKLLQKAKQHDLQAEAFVLEKNSFRAMSHQGEVVEYTSHETRGLGFRALKDGKMGYASTEAFDEEAIDQLIQGAVASATLCEDDDVVYLYDGKNEEEALAQLPLLDEKASEITTAQKLDALLTMEKEAMAYDPRIEGVSYNLVQSGVYTVRIANTLGLQRSYSENAFTLYTSPSAKEGTTVSSGDFGKTERSFVALNPTAIAKEAAKRAVEGLTATSMPTGAYRVIINNEAMCALLSVFASIFSAESEQQGLSLLSGKLGQTVATACVSIVDDPLLVQGLASRPFDAEGVPSKRHSIIENGVFNTFLHNLKTANKAGVKTTGNASKASYGASVWVSPSNFGFVAGTATLAELCTQAHTGVVITEVSGLHAGANPISGDFSLLSKGYFFENGKVQYAVEQITVAGNFYALLQQVNACGNDVHYDDSGIYSPSIDVGTLSISGS